MYNLCIIWARGRLGKGLQLGLGVGGPFGGFNVCLGKVNHNHSLLRFMGVSIYTAM